MNSSDLAVSAVAASQDATQQKLAIVALKSQANQQQQIASILDKAVSGNALNTSGSVGTQINTTA